MKRKYMILLIIFSCILIITGCDNMASLTYGSLTISFTNSVRESRSLSVDDIITDLSYVQIRGIHKDGLTFEKTVNFSASTTINSLLSGSWDFTIFAFNEHDQQIGIGTASTTILAKDHTSLTVTVIALTGEGSLEFTTSWPVNLVTDPQIVASLTKVGGEADPMPLECEISNGTATASVEIDNGSYTIQYALYEGEGRLDTDRVFGTTGSFYLAAGQKVTVSCPLVQNEMRLSGSLDVTINIDIRPTYAVSITPKTQTVFYSRPATLSVTASPPPQIGGYAYLWYLDGTVVEGVDKSTITFNNLPIGLHNVTASVFSGDTVFSDTTTIEVILPETHRVTYDGNGGTSGSVPSDSFNYVEGESIVVQSSGNLAKDGYYFYSWNTKDGGSGSHYHSGDTLLMGDTDLTLYACWKPMGIPQISTRGGHVLLIKRDRSLWATGYNSYGQLMDGFTDITVTTPRRVMGLYDEFNRISTTEGVSFVIKTDGSLWAAGANSSGMLGDGTKTDRKNPVFIMDGVKDVSVGYEFTIALKKDGTVWGWGQNSRGALGLPTVSESLAPELIAEDVKSISAGRNNSYIIKNDNTLWATGANNHGHLGTGDTIDRNEFTKVMDDVKMVSTYGATLILKTNGDLYATGMNSYGQLGDGTTTEKSTPTFIMGNVAMVSAGETHSMIIKTDDTLWATGSNENYALGDGSDPSDNRTEFYQIDTDVEFVESGLYISVYMKKDGSVWATGKYGYEYFGYGNITDKRKPIKVFNMW